MNKTESKGKNLRQKAVNLFYIIFLALIFSFIPSEFVDSAHHSNTSLDLISNELNRLNTTNSLYFIHLLKNEPAIFETTKEQFLQIERVINQTSNYIDNLKMTLVNEDGINDFGFFENGRKDQMARKVMLKQKNAEELYNKLSAFKTTIANYLNKEEQEKLNNILPLPKYEMNSEGHLIDAKKFYFDRTPLNVSVLNLSHFKSRVERIRVLAYNGLISKIVNENSSLLPFQNLQIYEGEKIADLYENVSINEFFERIKQLEIGVNKQVAQELSTTDYYFIETISDTIHPSDKPIKFNTFFDNKNNQFLSVQVKTKNGTELFKMSKPGEFLYFPTQKGKISFLFTSKGNTKVKTITVIDADPIIQNTRLSTLYVGIDNPLNVKTSEFDKSDDLEAEISQGEVIRKGDFFYARVYKKGIVKMSIFAQMPYGRIKIAEKSFVVRELYPPIPNLAGVKSGQKITLPVLQKTQALTLITDEYLIDEEVYISEFDFLAVFDNYNRVMRPIKNKGSSFNSEISDILKTVAKGDLLIFSNIKTLSSRGTENFIPSITITVD